MWIGPLVTKQKILVLIVIIIAIVYTIGGVDANLILNIVLQLIRPATMNSLPVIIAVAYRFRTDVMAIMTVGITLTKRKVCVVSTIEAYSTSPHNSKLYHSFPLKCKCKRQTSISNLIFALVTPAPTCPGGQFYCDNGQCIPYQFVCNKKEDCTDGSDEPPHCCKFVSVFII